MVLNKEGVLSGYKDDGSGELYSDAAQDIALNKPMLRGIKDFYSKFGEIKAPEDFEELEGFVRMYKPMLNEPSSKTVYDPRYQSRWVNFHSERLVLLISLEALRLTGIDPSSDRYDPKKWICEESRNAVLEYVKFWIIWISMYAKGHALSMMAEEEIGKSIVYEVTPFSVIKEENVEIVH